MSALYSNCLEQCNGNSVTRASATVYEDLAMFHYHGDDVSYELFPFCAHFIYKVWVDLSTTKQKKNHTCNRFILQSYTTNHDYHARTHTYSLFPYFL